MDDFLRDVEGGGSYVLIHDVDSIERQARFTAEAAAYGYPGVARLRWIERFSIRDFDAGFQLCQFEIVAAVERQLIDLCCVDNATYGGSLGIDGDHVRRYFDFGGS